jgi:hypothetical protein
MKPFETNFLLIVDYNLSRVKDVRMMADHARDRYGLETILIRPKPTETDKIIATHVFDLDPRDMDFVEKALEALAPFKERISAALPFSDNAVHSGATLALALGCSSDSSVLADAAFSKIKYREREQELNPYLENQGVFVPKFRRIEKIEDLQDFWKECPNGFVLKPSCEGNNRGVIRIKSEEELAEALEEVRLYKDGGLICEELIPFSEEFSYDGVGHLHFITQKESVTARYPVEKGQIIPALVPFRQTLALQAAGRGANLIVGQRTGPFHTEIKYDPETGRSAVIEPNRRPAGMKIWHLAERVYGINFFKTWVDQAVAGIIPSALPLPKGRAAIRQLAAPKKGILRFAAQDQFRIFNQILNHKRMREMTHAAQLEWFDFQITAANQSVVNPIPKDNAGFIAEVCVFSKDLTTPIQTVLNEFETIWFEVIKSFIWDLENRSQDGVMKEAL